MRYSLTKSSVVHPFLFAVMPFLFIISFNLDEIILQDIILPFLIVIASVPALWYILNKLLKNKMKSGLVISLSLVLFFSYGHFYNILYSATLGDVPFGINRFLLIIFLTVFGVGIFIIFKTSRHHKEITTIVNMVVIVILSISVFNISSYAFEDNISKDSQILNSPTSYENMPMVTLDYTPNVYYIILDEYADSKILESVYGFDNSDFLSELTMRGFHVSENSHSNYQSTLLSVTSSLNMKYLNYLIEDAQVSAPRLFHNLWNDNKVISVFDSYNYTTVTMPLHYGIPKISDYELCQNTVFLSETEIVLWESTILKPMFKALDVDQFFRNKIMCKFDRLSDLHNSVNEPFFVYAHFLLPHPPFVFGPNGEPVQSESLAPGATTIWEDKSKYLNQVKFANKKTIEVIDKILQESAIPPIIILQGDHGTPRSVLPDDAQDWDSDKRFEEGIRNRMSILNAYHLPDGGTELIYDGITPVNSFRLIFNSYFGTDYELLEDKMYIENENYNLTEVTDILRPPSLTD